MHKRLHARSVPDIIRYPTNSTNLVWANHLFHLESQSPRFTN